MTDPVGVPPASVHTLNPYCLISDIPQGRLLDANGKALADVDVNFAIGASTELLYHLSGRKYRSGRTVARPSQISRGLWAQSFLYPYNSMVGFGDGWGAGWAWMGGLGLGWSGGQDQPEVVLQGPVTAIHSVTVDGVALDASQYTLYDRRRLVRNLDTTGATTGVWPWNQNIAMPLTQPNTFSIDWSWGQSAGDGGRMACAALAVDLALALSGQNTHRLPARVISVATQGVNTAVGDALQFLEKDLTGIPAVDLWLRAVNPMRRRRRAAFASPQTVVNRST